MDAETEIPTCKICGTEMTHHLYNRWRCNKCRAGAERYKYYLNKQRNCTDPYVTGQFIDGDNRMIQQRQTEMEEQNRARELLGLPVMPIKVRRCIRCGRQFESKGARCCKKCGEELHDESGNMMEAYYG